MARPVSPPITFSRIVTASAGATDQPRAAIAVGQVSAVGSATAGRVVQLDSQSDADAAILTVPTDELVILCKNWFLAFDAPLLVIPYVYKPASAGNPTANEKKAAADAAAAAIAQIDQAENVTGLVPHLGTAGYATRGTSGTGASVVPGDTVGNRLESAYASALATRMHNEGGMAFLQTAKAKADAIAFATANNNPGGHFNAYMANQDVITPGDPSNALAGASVLMIARAYIDLHVGIMQGLLNETAGPAYVRGDPAVTLRERSASDASDLRLAGISTFVNHKGQRIIWGGRTAGATEDDPYSDGYVRRIAYEIEDQLSSAAFQFVGHASRVGRINASLVDVMDHLVNVDRIISAGSAGIDGTAQTAETNPKVLHILWSAETPVETEQINIRGELQVVSP